MKKLCWTLVLTIVCLTVCGCNNKEEVTGPLSVPKTVPATQTVTETVTETATETVTETVTETTTEAETTAEEIVDESSEEPSDESSEETSEASAEETTEETTAQPETTAPAPAESESKTANGHTLKVIDGITYVDGVLVANKTYGLPESYYPGGLTGECDSAYDKLSAAAAEAGYELYISSGFRDYYTQQSIYNRYVANDGKENADRYSARPGYSEHQTGLAIDLNGVSDSFGDTATGKWVAEHCHEYGFILRYPKGKEAQTGYMYEPWHIRYVGVDVATKIATSGLCLEEYFGITSEYQN